MVMLGGDIGYTNSKGKVFASRDILFTVISLAAKEIQGVAQLVGGRRLFGKSNTEGVKVNFLNDGIEVAIFIKVNHNVNIPNLASRIQENIKNGIASMLEVEVKNIDINVVGVDFSGLIAAKEA